MEKLINKNLSGNLSCEAWNVSVCVINPGSEIRAISVNSGVALFLCLLMYPNFSKVKNVDNYLFAGKLTKHNQAAANRSSCD